MATPPVHRLAVAADKVRAEQSENGIVPQMPRNQGTGLACSLCAQAGRENVPIVTSGRGFSCSGGGHSWVDNDALVESNPINITVKPTGAPPRGSVAMHVHVDPKLRERLEQRFAGRLDATCAALMNSLLDPNAFIVTGEDAQQMAQLTGRPVKSSRDVVGVVFQSVRERDQTREDMNTLTSPKQGGTGIVTPGQPVAVVLNLSRLTPEQAGKLRAHALHVRQSAEDVALAWLGKSLDNNWID